jgi:hypothetical protein
VCPIKCHGLRHTCATLLLQADVSIKVVQERFGHKRVDITLDIDAHALPSMRPDAAAKLAALLHFSRRHPSLPQQAGNNKGLSVDSPLTRSGGAR